MAGAAPTFSVVIPSLGEIRKLRRLLEVLARQTLARERFEIIVALDGIAPAPETEAWLAEARVKVVRLAERSGPGAARNRAAAEARGEFLAFTEDDGVPANDWLAAAAARLAADPAIDVLEGHTVEAPRRAGAGPRPDLVRYRPTNLFVRRALFVRLGGYHEGYFDAEKAIYFREDSDFGFTLEQAQARIAREPRAVVTQPVERAGWLDPLRWARRFEMDALLAARHPERFRAGVERRRLGPLRIRRPVVWAAWACVLGVAVGLLVPLLGRRDLTPWFLAVAAAAFLSIWAKWGFSLRWMPAMLAVPFVLVGSLVRGWVRVRTGVMR